MRCLRKNASILDMISDRTSSLRKDLGPGDQRALSDYMDTVRELERRVTMASAREPQRRHRARCTGR